MKKILKLIGIIALPILLLLVLWPSVFYDLLIILFALLVSIGIPALICYGLYRTIAKRINQNKHELEWGDYVCKSCGSRTYGRKKTQGSIGIEIILWCLMIVPGLIYSMWRVCSRKFVCHVCNHSDLIPSNTPLAQKIISA